jgi:hypothetical protein
MANARSEVNLIKPAVIVGHGKILFWWPVWAYGYFMAIWSYFAGVSDGSVVTINNELNFLFIVLLIFVIAFTNMKLPFSAFMIAVLAIAIVIILLKVESSIKILPLLFASIRVDINHWFYLSMATGLLAVWLISLFIYDRRLIFIVNKGQIVVRHKYNRQKDEIFRVTNARVFRESEDFVCHNILGLGLVSDIHIRSNDSKEIVCNVIFAKRRVAEIEKVFV